MRAAIVGTFFDEQPGLRAGAPAEPWPRSPHRDPRAIEGALYVAELAAACSRARSSSDRSECQRQARRIVTHHQLGAAIDRGAELARSGASTDEAARACGTSGFVVHTLGFATYALLQFDGDPLEALAETIAAGGDTDSIGAILGGWRRGSVVRRVRASRRT